MSEKRMRHFHAGKLRKNVGGIDYVEVAESNGQVFVATDGSVIRNGCVTHGNDNGHRYLTVAVAGHTTYVHRLVFEIFIGEIPDDMEIDHIDSSRNNNRLDNLRIVTHHTNVTGNPLSVEVRKAASRKSIVKAQEANRMAVAMVDSDGTEHWFPCQHEAALATGTHFTSISKVLHGKLKTAGGKRWCKAGGDND